MDPRTLPRILRIEGLIPFTLCAILLGFVVTLWEAGYAGAHWELFAIAGLAAVLIHIDGHIWNDIMDLEIDRFEKSRETGRDRPLVYGWATVSEYRKMSLGIMAVVVVLAVYLATQRIYIPFLFLLGFFFDYGYNHPRIALGHHPFTEWYIFPWLVVGVTVTVVYAATGILSLLAFIVSLLHGLTVTCFVVSMMRRDARSDQRGGKCTSSVLYPDLPHATIYCIVTLLAAVLLLFPLARILGSTASAYILILTTILIAGVNAILGARIDQLSTRALYSAFPDFEAVANRLMLRQAGTSLVHAGGITILLMVLGGIV
ncbi:MAG: UbiA family prenyltransferase [Methanomicrobiales archaeon]|nr:UbiA family prenyltransferase [Methanomicrobiales archaeon]